MNLKDNQIDRVKDLLGQALRAAANNLPNDRSSAEAKTHMRQALKKVDEVSQTRKRRRKEMTQNQFESWWGGIQAGTSELAASPMSAEAQMRSLGQLDAMIDAEKQKLEELEKESQSTPTELLQD
jgi:hypothetical protein